MSVVAPVAGGDVHMVVDVGAGVAVDLDGGRDEAGSATLWLVGLSALVAVTVLAAMLVAAASGARQRAEAAADLSALAAAAAAVRGADPCRSAAMVAAADRARLLRCSLDGDARVTVVTAVPLPPALRRFGVAAATAVARAGPVGS